MAILIIRNIPDTLLLTLQGCARKSGRTVEDEARTLLAAASGLTASNMRVGDELAALGKAFGGIELERYLACPQKADGDVASSVPSAGIGAVEPATLNLSSARGLT